MRKRILVADDSRTQRERLRMLLERADYEVQTASDGEEALALVERSPPDLIISDVVMPGMHGFAFCQAVRANPGTRRVPFILVTEWTAPMDIVKGLEAGADNFIPKPYDQDQLLARIRRIFRQLELRKQGRLDVEVTMQVGNRRLVVTADKQQIIELLFSTFEELGRVNSELQEAAADAERANLAKSEFLSRMSHELRTPLNAILGFGQLLELDHLSPEQLEGVRQILNGGRHLLDLINEVLDISRIEAGRMLLSLEPVSVAEVLLEVLDLVRPLVDQRGIRLEAPAAGACDRRVRADRQRLKQILLNLLSNAVKYNRQGGTVTISCDETPRLGFRIAVSDTGPGIAPGKMARLFTPFERLGAEQTSEEGTGLGLALAKKLAEAMGGTMGVESTVDVGSTFWVALELVEGVLAADRSEQVVEASTGLPGGPFTVLYIEDNLSNVKLVEQILSRQPAVKLVVAMLGRRGLDLVREDPPDLVLLDLNLPDVPGGEILRALREDPRTSEIPVVVISADAIPSQIERLLGEGAQEYLTKPLDVQRLLEVLRKTLTRRNAPTRGSAADLA
jgi:signal transduction histidine kinase